MSEMGEAEIVALGFHETSRRGRAVVVAVGLDAEGTARELGVRAVDGDVTRAKVALFGELASRGLSPTRAILVDDGGSRALAQRVRSTFGSRGRTLGRGPRRAA